MIADDISKLATSSIASIINCLSWIYSLVPEFKYGSFSLLELGSGTGKAAICFVILTQGRCKVTGVEIVRNDLFSSMRDCNIYDKLLPNDLCMDTLFQAHFKCVLDIKSGHNYDVIFAQVIGMNDDAY